MRRYYRIPATLQCDWYGTTLAQFDLANIGVDAAIAFAAETYKARGLQLTLHTDHGWLFRAGPGQARIPEPWKPRANPMVIRKIRDQLRRLAS